MQWLKDRTIHNGTFSLFFVIAACYASLSNGLEPQSSLIKWQMGQALYSAAHRRLADAIRSGLVRLLAAGAPSSEERHKAYCTATVTVLLSRLPWIIFSGTSAPGENPAGTLAFTW